MDCCICLDTYLNLNNLCNTCNCKICRKCINNFEKYNLEYCPLCRSRLNTEINFDIKKYILHNLLFYTLVFSFISIQYILPMYKINHLDIDSESKYLVSIILSVCFFVIQHVTTILCLMLKLINNDRINIVKSYSYYIIFNISFLILIFFINFSLSLLILYISVIYIFPFVIISGVALLQYFNKFIFILKKENYKRMKIVLQNNLLNHNETNV